MTVSIVRLAFITSLAAACSSPVDTNTLPPPPPLTGAAPFLVSNALPAASANLLGNASHSGSVAYVSLPPGTLPGAAEGSIRVDRTGRVVSVALIDGGLDPVAVEAVAGDTITLVLSLTAGGTSAFRFTVPASKPPVIVRTVPPKNKRDVPLNSRMTVVFTEPIDAASLTPQNFQLRSGATTVAGRLAFANAEHTSVEFTPDADLLGGATYELVVGQGIRDRDGTPLEAPATVAFTTLAAPVGDLIVTTTTTGLELAPIGYSISVDGGVVQSIGVLSSIAMSNVASGSHTVALSGVGDNCTVVGKNPRLATVVPGETAAVRFAVACAVTALTQLAFVRDSQIYLINADGSGLVRLTNTDPGVSNRDPTWSPDGQRLAFASNRGGAWQIYAMDADGSNVVQRTSTSWWKGEPAWSPDGRSIAFTSYRHGNFDVYVVNADNGLGSEAPVVLSSGFDAQPAWSADGLTITFSSDLRSPPGDQVLDLKIVNADGSGLRTLIEGRYVSSDDTRLFFQPAWSPDGRNIVAVVCGDTDDSWEACTPTSEIVLMNADGSAPRVVAQPGSYAKPTWSPDGRTIAFAAALCVDCDSSIRFVRVDGSGEGLIVANGGNPAWRP